MFSKNICGEIQSKMENPTNRFLVMFLGAVPGSLSLFAAGTRDFRVLQPPSLAWSGLALAVFVSLSVASGCWMFWQTARTRSLLPCYR